MRALWYTNFKEETLWHEESLLSPSHWYWRFAARQAREVVENPNFVFDDLPLTEEPIEASVVIARRYNSGEPEDVWFWKFAEGI